MASRPPALPTRVAPVVPLPTREPRRFHAPLPTPLTSLVGREREVTAVRALLGRDGVRLVTLTGPGGVGKTRLALRVGDEIGGASPEGVVFVGLAQIRDPDQVLPAIARALGVRETPGQTPDDLLRAVLRDRPPLLVLDNLEQVLGATPRLAALLIACPSLRILATSRELLGVSGERGFAVPPLSLPETGSAPIPAPPRPGAGRPETGEDPAAEAVRLFVARAQALRPNFALDGDNADVVVEICRRVDGLPLGIELAAARRRHLSAASLLRHLDRRLPLLTGGPRDAPDRLRTMRDAIAWSYDLLTPAERALFRRLSVFVAGFGLEAAEAVAGERDKVKGQRDDPPGAPPDAPSIDLFPSTLELVSSLVDKSLVRVEPESVGETRYGLLETVREFGLERLAASGEEDAVRQRHADWCLTLADQAGPHAKRPDAPVWLAALEREHANLRAALTWLAERDDGRRLVELAGALWPFWHEHAHYREGSRWLERALDRGREAPAADRLRALTGAGTLAWYRRDVAAARRWNERALALAREVGNREAEAFALNNLSAQTRAEGDQDGAIALCEAGLAVARAAGEPEPAVAALHNLAVFAWTRGDTAAATHRVEEGLALAREHGVQWLVPTMLVLSGFVTVDLDHPARAAALFREALELGGARGNLGDVIDAMEGLGRVGVDLDRMEQAARLFAAAVTLREEIGTPLVPEEVAYFAPLSDALHDALGAAGYAGAWAAGRVLSREEALAEAFALAAEPTVAPPVAPPPSATAANRLTPREVEILRLLVAGESNREIADRLFIGRTTAARHVANIFAKLGVDSRAKATAFAHRHGLG